MSRFVVSREEERLTLTEPMERRLLMLGCPLFACAAFSVLLLAFLSVIHEAQTPGTSTSTEPLRFFDPSVNHFGFLWLVASVLLAILVPLYAFLIHRDSVVFTFDRSNGRFSRHGKVVAPLRRIEYLQIRKSADGGGMPSYTLFVVYLDGHEMFIEQSHDEDDTWRLAMEIADFLSVRAVGSQGTTRSLA